MVLLRILIHSRIIIIRSWRKNLFHGEKKVFSAERISKHHIKEWFKSNGKQRIIMPKKGDYFKLKNYERNMSSPYMIYTDFESILVPEDTSYTNKYQKHITCSYGCQLACVDDKVSELFRNN